MCLLKKNVSSICLLLLLLLSVSPGLQAQSSLRFKGPIQLGEYAGSADYHYRIVNGDTLLMGPFSLQSLRLDELLTKGNHFYSIEGFYLNDQPDSTWQFRLGDLKVAQGTEWIDYHFNVKLTGTQHTAMAPLLKGNPHGLWTHTVESIERSTVQQTLFKSSIELNQGVPQGIFRVKQKGANLLGRFSRDGRAHDSWVLNDDAAADKMETWTFVQGRLQQIELMGPKGRATIPVYPEKISPSTYVNLDARFFKILEVQRRFDSADYADRGGMLPKMIAAHAGYMQAIGHAFEQFSQFSQPVSPPEFRVEVAHYPLNSQEWEYVDIIQTHLQKIDKVSQSLQGNTRLNILKHSDEEMLFLLSTVKEIVENYLIPARNVSDYASVDALDFCPREYLTMQSAYTADSYTQIPVRYKDSTGVKTRTFTGPKRDMETEANTELAYLARLTTYAWACVDSIERNLTGNLKQQELQLELEEIEKRLLAQSQQLADVIDTARNQLPEPYTSNLGAIQETVNIALRAYALEDDLTVKPEHARQLIGCMEGMEELVGSLKKLPDRWEKIQQLYTEQVWNPFTATTMKDQVKERIPQAYNQLLIPSILNRMATELTCRDTQEVRMLLDMLYERMQQLRIQNTSKLERKLKNEDDPNVVMDLFEISMQKID